MDALPVAMPGPARLRTVAAQQELY